jgi:hypothetical protein
MYLTDKYVFIHKNKCAGVFVKDWMIKHMDAKIIKYKHAPIRMLPEKYRKNRKVIGVTRNPFSWYVSYYHYHQQEAGTYRDMSFKEYVLRHTMNPRPLLSLMGKKVRKKYPKCYPPKTKLKIGAWTYHYVNYFCYQAWEWFEKGFLPWYTKSGSWMYPGHDLDYLWRTETLKRDMIKTFGEKYTSRIHGFKKRNKSKHKKYQLYYDNEMIDLINKREGVLMERLGYSFE